MMRAARSRIAVSLISIFGMSALTGCASDGGVEASRQQKIEQARQQGIAAARQESIEREEPRPAVAPPARGGDLATSAEESSSPASTSPSFTSPSTEPQSPSPLTPLPEGEGNGTRAPVSIYGESLSREAASGSSSSGQGALNLAQITFSEEGENFDPDVNPDGDCIAFASTQHRESADIYLKPINGRTLTQLTTDPADDITPEFSPDGRWIAFASNRGGSFDIYIMPDEGGQSRLITDDAAHELHPTWSPNGAQLAYCRLGEQSNRWELWIVDVENTASRSFIDYGFLPEWSPDPARGMILFQRPRERGSRYHGVWTIELSATNEGRRATEIVSANNAAVINPSWSPDAERIVFATVIRPELSAEEKPTASDLWVINLDGTERSGLTSGDDANYQPTWGADGRIYFISDRTGHDTIWSIAAENRGHGFDNARNLGIAVVEE